MANWAKQAKPSRDNRQRWRENAEVSLKAIAGLQGSGKHASDMKEAGRQAYTHTGIAGPTSNRWSRIAITGILSLASLCSDRLVIATALPDVKARGVRGQANSRERLTTCPYLLASSSIGNPFRPYEGSYHPPRLFKGGDERISGSALHRNGVARLEPAGKWSVACS